MATLITLLISLLGYGTPADFTHMSEDQLQTEIMATQTTDGGDIGEWDVNNVYSGAE